jgi:acyl transferase domain-containing protein
MKAEPVHIETFEKDCGIFAKKSFLPGNVGIKRDFAPIYDTGVRHLETTVKMRGVTQMDRNHIQTSLRDDLEDAVAIIGISCKFPGAATPEAFWENLKHGVESVTFFTDDRLETSGVSRRLRENPNYVRAGAIIEDIDRFDAEFFGYSPSEAALIDPQQRIFLEQAWLALEDAGYDSGKNSGIAGVFGGTGLNTYFYHNVMTNPRLNEAGGGVTIGGDGDFLATRVSYKCNLTGPSMTVQTAGSTSLVAVHLACQSIRSGECDLALAGGVTVRIPQQSGYLYQEGGALSPDGHCRAFDAGAAGTVPGNGAGMVVLKRLGAALAEGDRIYAVIRGSALNNDGALKAGFTVPGLEQQAMVIWKALTAARVDPVSVTYVEANGSGSPVDDPIEIKALIQAYGRERVAGRRCAIGSVKTNIGHLDAAAGVAGLIKTVLALQNREIPPSLNCETPHPGIAFESSPFFVNTGLSKWERQGNPLRAGVSSFGKGGTNVHLIVEEAPVRNGGTEARAWQLFTLSARNHAALLSQATNLKNHLFAEPGVNLADAAFTLQLGRRDFNHRLCFICRDQREAVAALDEFLSNCSPAETTGGNGVAYRVCEGRDLPVVFLLPGESDHKTVYGAELYQKEPCFRENIDGCADLIFELMQTDLRRILYPEIRSESSRDYSFEAQELPIIIRAALFASQYALARLWMEWGIKPGTLAGLDWLGETVALCLAGVWTLEEALTVAIDGQTDVETGISLNRAQIPVIFGFRPAKTPAFNPGGPAFRNGNTRKNPNLNMMVKNSHCLVLQIGPDSLCPEVWGRDGADPEPAFAPLKLEDELAVPDGAETAALLRKMGQLWLAGARVDWNGLHVNERRRRISLPGYPFQRESFWCDPPSEAAVSSVSASAGGGDSGYIKAIHGTGAGNKEVAALQENRE